MVLTIVSSSICPYALRVAAALLYKKIDFEVKLIDLQNPPQWFKDISPLEKVPVLIVDDKRSLTESNVILEYVDSLKGASLQPADPFEKALQKSRAEFASEIILTLAGIFRATTEEQYSIKLADLKWHFEKLEAIIKGPYLTGPNIQLVDFSYAPVYVLLLALKLKQNVLEGFPKVKAYGDKLLAIPEVLKAKKEDYDKHVQEILVLFGSFAAK